MQSCISSYIGVIEKKANFHEQKLNPGPPVTLPSNLHVCLFVVAMDKLFCESIQHAIDGKQQQ